MMNPEDSYARAGSEGAEAPDDRSVMDASMTRLHERHAAVEQALGKLEETLAGLYNGLEPVLSPDTPEPEPSERAARDDEKLVIAEQPRSPLVQSIRKETTYAEAIESRVYSIMTRAERARRRLDL